MSSSEGYILNAVSDGRPMWGVWKAIHSGAEETTEIQTNTGLSSSQVQNALRGLTFFRLIEERDGYDTIPLEYGDTPDPANFALTSLSNIANECSVPPGMATAPADESGWGKQAVMSLTLEYFITHNRQYFDRKGNNELATTIDKWQQKLNFHPRGDSGSRNDLQGNKLDNWTRIMEFFGFVRLCNGTNYTVYIQPEVIQRLLTHASAEIPNEGPAETAPEFDIRDCLDWISQNFFRVSLTDDSEIPSIFGQALVELSAQNRIRLVETTDADSVGLEGISQPQSMDKAANCIKVLE